MKHLFVNYDSKERTLHEGIDKLVSEYSWKQFFFAVLKYQKNKIKSAYEFLIK